MELKKFTRDLYSEYKSWFADPELDRRLGPMDEEWLECVLAETDGVEYAAFQNGEMVGVVGIKFPDAEHPVYTITDLAVKPELKGKGVGSQMLSRLMEMHPLKEHEYWVGYVDEKNPKAGRFLESNRWTRMSTQPDEHGMIEYRNIPA